MGKGHLKEKGCSLAMMKRILTLLRPKLTDFLRAKPSLFTKALWPLSKDKKQDKLLCNCKSKFLKNKRLT